MMFGRGRRRLELQGLDVGRDCDGFDVFEILVIGTLTPGQKLLDRPVIGDPSVRVANGDLKKL